MAGHRIVIVGGGFGGLNVALGLAGTGADVTLVDRRNFHLFQPLLYQVATGGLSPADIASPLRAVVKRQRNTTVFHDVVTGIDPREKKVRLESGELEYDTLVLATGVVPHYFGHDGWERYAPGLKTVEDATRIRSRILEAFERAERASDKLARKAWMTFVIVGGGPTGVELAGAVGELASHTLRRDFRSIDSSDARVVLVEGGPRLLSGFNERLALAAHRSLERLGVEVACDTLVENIDEGGVALRGINDTETNDVRAGTVLWATRVRVTPLGDDLYRETGARTDHLGRVEV